ncbi:hypothetical protein SARC_07570 [Sphaeroforma arctica JP610]|uniref:Uncharacterized protein n=1 Tax=Sphaeroforma arctica JP610 TaxID=667725 RepID=A0A0L0FU49_9EUKA|nr:hypothetical protein SARC_07570 [Sphaeroforma arctica JP610]KNC80061.1 hypothetical protein SARC_07570 [Sphaeroforma arctica JP610]|eukprot:XP_014153963.1 hypothetical protein SARC_07570 [Sphaeroforma arctica JP610]
METHELLQLLSPDIQEAQIRSNQRLVIRRCHNGDTTRGETTNSRLSPHIVQRQQQQWQQRPTPTTNPTTCNGCRAQAPPALRHIPRWHHYRAAQPGEQDVRTRTSAASHQQREAIMEQQSTPPQGSGHQPPQYPSR